MRPYGKIALATLLIFTIIACSIFTPKGETSPIEPISPSADSECTKLNLTPEEMANCGAHEYSISTQGTGECADDSYNGKASAIITASSEGLTAATWTLDGEYVIQESWTRIKSNTYSTSNHYYNNATDYGDKSGVVTLSMNGFTRNADVAYNDGSTTTLCTWLEEYTLAN